MLNQVDGGSGGGLFVERWGEGWFTGTNWFADKSAMVHEGKRSSQRDESSETDSLCDFQEIHEDRSLSLIV